MNKKIYDVNYILPDDGEKVLCYGHHTLCCKEDMEETPEWHEVTFSFHISQYILKKKIPDDPEESILESYKVTEQWDCGPKWSDGLVIGVTQWRYLDD